MWKGTGRSGIGSQSISGGYDDWDGLSMNGRQFKSRETKETRDLSGADYWHQRKALEPKMLEDIPTFVNGRPNIQAFAEPVAKTKPQAKKKSAFEAIMLADRNYERLCGLSEQLDQELDSGKITDFDAYCAARKNIDKRLAAGWSRVCKERSWQEEESLDNTNESGLHFSLDEVQRQEIVRKNKHKTHEPTGWLVVDGLSEDNVFKGLFSLVKKVMMFAESVIQTVKWEK